MKKRTLRLDKELISVDESGIPDGGYTTPDDQCSGGCPTQWPICSALCSMGCSALTCPAGQCHAQTGNPCVYEMI